MTLTLSTTLEYPMSGIDYYILYQWLTAVKIEFQNAILAFRMLRMSIKAPRKNCQILSSTLYRYTEYEIMMLSSRTILPVEGREAKK